MRPHSQREFLAATAPSARHEAAVARQLAALGVDENGKRLKPGSRRPTSGRAATTAKPEVEPIPCTHAGCTGPCTEYALYRLIWVGRPKTTNGNLKGALRSRMAAEREIHQRIAAMLEDRPIPTLARALIEVRGYLPNKAGAWDWDGTSLWVKAVQDALVAAGVLPSDTWRHAMGGLQWAVAVDADGPLRVEFDVIANPPYVRLDTGGDTTVVVVAEQQ